MPEVKRRLWRRWVIAAARRMPIESAGACMAISVFFALGAIYFPPRAAHYAMEAPGIGQAFRSAKDGGGLYLRELKIALIIGATGAAWIFQARCLQLCFPDFYDPYATD